MGPLKEVPWRRTGEPLGGAARRNVALMVLALGQSAADPDVRQTLLAGAKTSIMLLFVIANAMLFAHVLTTERIPHALAEAIISWGLSPWQFLIAVNILLLIAGNFMEPSAILLIMAPIRFTWASSWW